MSRRINDVMTSGYKNAVRLVRTEMNFVNNQAAYDSMDEAGILYYEFIAVLDNRTSKVCQSRDGEVYPMSEKSVGFNYPPLHPRCRSTVAPYIENSGRLGTRVAKVNGRRLHVSESMKYEEFKQKYLTDTIDNAKIKQSLKVNSDLKNSTSKLITRRRLAAYSELERLGFKVESTTDLIDEYLLKSTVDQLKTLENHFEVLKKYKSKSISSEESAGSIACVESDFKSKDLTMKLSLCANHYSDRQALCDRCIKLRDTRQIMAFADEMAEVYPVTHEYGHIVENYIISQKADLTNFSLKERGEFFENQYRKIAIEIIDIAKNKRPKVDFREYASGLARKGGYAEFFAEVFANSQLGKSNILGEAVTEWLKKEGF